MQQVLQRVVDAVGWDGTVAGEAVDLHSEGSTLDFETLEFIHSRKTGALFVAGKSSESELIRRVTAEGRRLWSAIGHAHLGHNLTKQAEGRLGPDGDAQPPVRFEDPPDFA